MNRFTKTIERHRRSGRGRKATWIALGAAALIGVMWFGSPIAGREQTTTRGRHWVHVRGDHSLTDLSAELREDSFWLARAGITTTQTERFAALLDQRGPEFEAFEVEQSALTARIAEVLSAPELEIAEVVALTDDVKRLAIDVLDATFDLLTAAIQDLTPELRADLIRHWEEW